MAKRASMSDKEKKVQSPMVMVIAKEKAEKKDQSLDDTKRQTYYLSHRTIMALALYSASTGIEKSAAVSKALEEFLPKEYFEQAENLPIPPQKRRRK